MSLYIKYNCFRGDDNEFKRSFLVYSNIKKYYFEDKTVYQIAEEENATHQAISKSLKQAIEKLQKIYTLFYQLFFIIIHQIINFKRDRNSLHKKLL